MSRRMLASVMAFLLSALPLRARDPLLGIIMRASGAHISSAEVSSGASIYDGDHISTIAEGFLQLRSGPALVYLPGQSWIILHAAANGMHVDLSAGSLVFSTPVADAVEVQVDGALVRPAASVPTVAQVTILGPKALQITTRRGALEFFYRGETRNIPEGVSYTITLDQPQAPSAPGSDDRTPSHKGGREGKFFKIALISGGVAIVGVTIWAIHEALESPDRP